MTVSMRKMSPGSGYRYLLKSVVASDGDRSLSTPLTRYYAEAGTPPGRWLGSGLSGLGDGQLVADATVHEAQLALLMGMGRDPITGDQLGRAFLDYGDAETRIDRRIAALPDDLPAVDRDAAVAEIEAEEAIRSGRRPVAAFDFTFSVPKSVSVLWGLADADTQAMIVEAHHAAVAETIDYLEREVAATRQGTAVRERDGSGGAVAQVKVDGVIAAAFDHYDSRAGDPQLHTHVVLSNKVRASSDGRWRSLDSRPIHASVTALSAHYNALLADRLSGTFGLSWDARQRGAERNEQWEITGVSERLINAFSSRTREIEIEKDRLIDTYVERHGRRPSAATIVRLRAQATLATRPEKQVRSLADLTGDWRARGSDILRLRNPGDAAGWARALVSSGTPQAVSAGAIPADVVEEVARRAIEAVSEKRSTWRHWNLWAAASKETMGWRFTTAADREQTISRIVDAAVDLSTTLTPPEIASTPPELQRDDGTSVFRPRHGEIYTSTEIVTAEDRLLARSETARPELRATGASQRTEAADRLSADQRAAIDQITDSGRVLDLLVGPAGAGKTTAMRGLLEAWGAGRGSGRVIGLAPSANAAAALAADLGIPCENTAKWLHEHQRDDGFPPATFNAGDLVIIDEATLADTRSLDSITGHAESVGAKVLLVGDPAQLSSVDAGGAFAMLVTARSKTDQPAPTLTEIHRFTHDWEKSASSLLRAGDPLALATYARHQRLHDGTTASMIDAAYAAWRTDIAAGRTSLLVTDSNRVMHDLNARARAERLLSTGGTQRGALREVLLAGEQRASVGDLVITRLNDRNLSTTDGHWVKNGDRWTITDIAADGSVTLHRDRASAGKVVVPPEYVAEHLDLGYAVTAHRAQGLTVATAHTVVTTKTSREHLYVAMTRGRNSNQAYVALDEPDDSHTTPEPDGLTAKTVLTGILRHTGGEASAHDTLVAEREAANSIARLAAEYEMIAANAQRPRWIKSLGTAGLTRAQVADVVEGTSFGPLAATLRLSEAHGHDADAVLAAAVSRRTLADADDIGAVLHQRIRLAADHHIRGKARFIAGLIPEALGPMGDDHRRALDERRELIEHRALALAEAAVADGETWVWRAGRPPRDDGAQAEWLDGLATIAAYRDRYAVTGAEPIGTPDNEAQRADARRARTALRSLHSQGKGAAYPQAHGACRTPARRLGEHRAIG